MTARPFNGKLVGVGLTSCAVLRPGGKGAGDFQVNLTKMETISYLAVYLGCCPPKRRCLTNEERSSAPFDSSSGKRRG